MFRSFLDKADARLNSSGIMQSAADSPFVSWVFYVAMFWVVAAAAHSGFFAKWGLRDGDERYGVERMIDGTAHKPFVYRQLIPLLANAAETITPSDIKNKFVSKFKPQESFSRATAATAYGYEFRYVVIYTSSFAALFLSLILLRRTVLGFGGGRAVSFLAPTVFVLAFPYIQTVGGYYYDAIELAFLSGALLLSMSGRVVGLIGITAIATLNKETFLLFLPTLYPVLRQRMDRNRVLVWLAVAVLLSGVINVLLRLYFSGNAGHGAEFHLFHNLHAYLSPWTYRQFEVTYGIPGPSGASFLVWVITLLVCIRGWSACPTSLKSHIKIASAINIPLFLAFCYAGELRNLSLLFVGFVVMMAFAMEKSGIESKGPSRFTASTR